MSRLHQAIKQYHYGDQIKVFEGCNINLLLKSFSEGVIYYDPGIKLENADTDKPVSKRRSQFRVSSKNLNKLYLQQEEVRLTTMAL